MYHFLHHDNNHSLCLSMLADCVILMQLKTVAISINLLSLLMVVSSGSLSWNQCVAILKHFHTFCDVETRTIPFVCLERRFSIKKSKQTVELMLKSP